MGLSQQEAILATTVGLAGGIVAAFIIGPLMDRFGPYIVVAGLFAVSALSVVMMASLMTEAGALMLTAMSLALGFCLSGGQKANNALSVYFYPTALRGTGLGWALGIGRIGGVIGPLSGGRSARRRLEPIWPLLFGRGTDDDRRRNDRADGTDLWSYRRPERTCRKPEGLS